MTACFFVEPNGWFLVFAKVHCVCGEMTTRMIGQFEGDPSERRDPDWDDIEWPASCDSCGAKFDFDDDGIFRVLGRPRMYRLPDGSAVPVTDLSPGAMWDAPWLARFHRTGPDGRNLVVRLPDGHDWHIDGRASNCTLPDDKEHFCWVRHGEPPQLTVDKAGHTCGAGGGSIQTGSWHGFLRDGVLAAV